MRRNLKLPEGLDEFGFDENGLWNKTSRFSKETGFDRDGYDKDGFNLDGINREGFRRDGINIKTQSNYDLDGYDIKGYDKDGYDRDGFDILGIDKSGINKDTQNKDERILFAEEFIKSQKTIEMYAKDVGLLPEEAEKRLNIIRNSPYINIELTEALEKNSDRFLAAAYSTGDKLISGEISLKDVKKVDSILGIYSGHKKEKLMEAIIKGVVAHDIKILEYKSIFGIEEYGWELPQQIIERMDALNTYVKKTGNKELMAYSKDIYKEKDRIKTYKAPYKPDDLKSVGYLKEGEKEPKILQITDEHIQMAKQYLHETGEYICYKTMSAAFTKIAKGELNKEVLDSFRENVKQKERQKSEEEEKQELIEIILKQQKQIAQQKTEINELKSQRRQRDE